MQHTSHILMIKPVNFDFNAETAVNNRFQVRTYQTNVQANALKEFENFISLLRKRGIDVTVIEDSPEPHTPDSLFPNNWISFHEKATVILYPMFALNRRQERKQQVLNRIKERFLIDQTIDLTGYELENKFLEGTGSMVLDRENKIAYACLSQRTNETVLNDFCKRTGYTPVCFTAVDSDNQAIYHTNVMMCVADEYAVICLESIHDAEEKQLVTNHLIRSGKKMITISQDQMNQFAGNMLQVHNTEGKKFLVMSAQAYSSLNKNQLRELAQFNTIIQSDITTIETNGGGSVRCMMAEIFLPVNEKYKG